jgi:hypothetical protein
MADAYLLMDARELRRQIRGLEATSADEDRKESHLAALRRERDALLHRAQAAEAEATNDPSSWTNGRPRGLGRARAALRKQPSSAPPPRTSGARSSGSRRTGRSSGVRRATQNPKR